MILILSHAGDDHANGVLSELSRRGHPATLLDSSQYPANASLIASFSGNGVGVEYINGQNRVDLSECHAAWWRRPLPFTLHDDLDPEAMSFVYSECHEAFSGALALLDATWVNSPHLDERAQHKPLQLATAKQVGLNVPRTLITNNPDEARLFIDEVGAARTVYKTFLASEEHWRETRTLRDDELGMLESVSFAPVIFQEFVPSEADIRVTIVGEEMFAADIRSNPHGYAVDYRLDIEGAVFAATELPDDVKKLLRAFMKSLGLVYGAVDLLRTADGEYIFLEINPAGEWRFVEERTAQPITTAMADLLIRLDVLREK